MNFEQIKQAAFEEEIEKIALSGKTLASAARKAAVKDYRMLKARLVIFGKNPKLPYSDLSADAATILNANRNRINNAIRQSRKEMSTIPIRASAKEQLEGLGSQKRTLTEEISAKPPSFW
jgi:hypothetical protein